MTITSQDYAQLAEHSYDRQGDLHRLVGQAVELGGVEYRVQAIADKASGYQGAIYQRVDTGEMVVAHRGTEFEREKRKDLVLTDGGMVANRSNRQADDAIELTGTALALARQYASENGVQPPQVTVTGHSLGGTLAQVTAHHFGLKGETFNAFGAVSLGRRIPEGGNDVINHVMAHDMVAAGSPQYGQVRVYATPEAIDTLRRQGYDNDRSVLDLRHAVPAAVAALGRGSHDMHNFLPVDGQGRPDTSVLDDPQALRLAAQYDPMIDKYRADVSRTRAGVTMSLRGAGGLLDDAIDFVRGPLAPGEPAARDARNAPQPGGGIRDEIPMLEPVIVRPEAERLQPAAGNAARARDGGTDQHNGRAHEPVVPSRASRPDDPGHPDHELLEKLRDGVRGLDRGAGKGWDANSERLAASALVMAKQKGFSAGDDLQLAFNRPTERFAAGEVLHLFRQGPHASHDPAANRAHMPTVEALSMPAEARYQQAAEMDIAQQRVQAQQVALQQQAGQQDPARGAFGMRM